MHRDYKREEATAEKRAREIGYNHRETEDFATGWLVCSGESKSEFAGEMGLPADAGDADIAHLYASEWPAKDVEAIYAGCMYGLARTPAHFPASSPSAEELWEREFVAISVTGRGGRQPPVHQPPEIKLGFGSEQAHNVGWTARCNDFGADARVTATRIEVEPAFGTEIGCPGGQEREDEWLLRFMDSDPEWRLDGNKLTLTSNRAQIEWEGQRGSD